MKTKEGLRILGLKEKNILTLAPNKTPCDEDAVKELYRLRIMKIGIVLDNEVQEMLEWILDFPNCFNCKKWICQCTCKM